MSPSRPLSSIPGARWAPAAAAVALLCTVVVAGVAGSSDDGGGDDAAAAASSSSPAPTTTTPSVVTDPTTIVPAKTQLPFALSNGNSGPEVLALQQRLKELGFDPGPLDGEFGNLTRMAVWAFEKLVLQVPSDEATGRVTNEMWQRMQDPLVVVPRRPDAPSVNHTEIYLPEQVVVFFVDDKPALISHMSSGTGEEWCEEVTISPGEYGNENGTEPLKRGECGLSTTPGGVYEFYRRVEGVRQSGLGGMWNPVYFNYGIAIHGAMNVPLHPASHGCIRIPMTLSEYFQDLAGDGDTVYVFDGLEEPETYGAQPPTFNWPDPDYTTTTTVAPSTTQPATTTATRPTTATAPAVTAPATTRPPTTPAPTAAPTTAVPTSAAF